MDGDQLHLLGKRLIEIARVATDRPGDPAMTPGETAVLEAAMLNPDSSIGELAALTRFAQSHVSTSVTRLRERGLLRTTADPADGRRSRVQVTESAARAIVDRAARTIDDAVAAVVADPAEARRAAALLEELARLLL